MLFPIYRKRSNDKNYYKIISDREFFEKQIVGTKVFIFHHIIDKYPEIILLRTIIDMEDSFVNSDAIEYESIGH